MRRLVVALGCGLLFGAGLVVSDMINPARVLAFLDVSGAWDPSLAFVMGGALIPSSIAYLLRRRMAAPVTAPEFQVPESRGIDRPLILGAVLFGLGWGLVGLCPGPALAALTTGAWQVFLFVGAMLAGMGLYRLTLDRSAATARSGAASGDIDMDIRQLDPGLSTSSQVQPEDLPAIARRGYRSIVSNRPDGEAPDQPTAARIAAAAEAAGLEFRHIPVVGGAIGEADIAAFRRALAELPGPILGFCRSGARTATLWALARREQQSPDALIDTARAAGHDLAALRPRLEGTA